MKREEEEAEEEVVEVAGESIDEQRSTQTTALGDGNQLPEGCSSSGRLYLNRYPTNLMIEVGPG